MARFENDGPAARADVGLVSPLITHDPTACADCRACVRHCPTHAIAVVDGRGSILEDRCVKCGQCVTECPQHAYAVRDDLPAVRSLLASGRPVVALLATEHVAALHPRSLEDVTRALEAAGFSAVETTVVGEELVAAAYEQVDQRAGSDSLPRLRSTCPVTVEWVRRFAPQLTEALVPLVPPYVAHARLVRELYPDRTAIVYVSPCWARKDDIRDPAFGDVVDVAIGFDELLRLLAETPEPPAEKPSRRRAYLGKQLSATDGFPRRTLVDHDLTDGRVATVRGLRDIDRLLTAIVRGEIAPALVDMLACEGCLDGPCVGNGVSVFAKRGIALAEQERQPPPVVDSRAFLGVLPSVELRRGFSARPARGRRPTAEEIDAVLAAGEFAAREDTIDCGACGHDTCVELAAAICLGHASWNACFPLERKRLIRERERLQRDATIDALTRLPNRGSLDARLAEESARCARYGTTLSLLLLDLDGFKSVNDRLGHGAGDELLRAVGHLLGTTLRASDIAARYGGDEFAVLLPQTGKTEAWAAAEKLRAEIAAMRLQLAGGGEVGTTASVGVATLGEAAPTVSALLEAADEALYRAKRLGRDRVDLSAG